MECCVDWQRTKLVIDTAMEADRDWKMKIASLLKNIPMSDLKPTFRSLFVRDGIGTNSFLSLVSLSMQFLSNAVLIMILARLVDVGTLGEILYATSFSNIVVVLVSYGLENLSIREVSQGRYKIDELISNLLLTKLILSGVVAVLVCLFINMVPVPLKNSKDLWFYVSAALFNSFIKSFIALRKGVGDFGTQAKVSLLRSGIFFVGTLSAVLIWDATTLLVGQVRLLSRVVALAFTATIFIRKLSREHRGRSWGPKVSVVRKLFVVGFPFALQAVLGTAYFQLDTLILGAFKTSTEVGYYQAPMQIISMVMLVPIAIIQAYFPKLAQALNEPGSSDRSLMKQMLSVLSIFGLSLTVLFMLGASILITFVYGTSMQPSIVVMRILSVVFVVRSVASGLGISLVSLGLEKVSVLAGFVALVGSLGLNLLLIPTGGFVAAAWVNLITNLLVLVIYSLWWKRVLPVGTS